MIETASPPTGDVLYEATSYTGFRLWLTRLLLLFVFGYEFQNPLRILTEIPAPAIATFVCIFIALYQIEDFRTSVDLPGRVFVVLKSNSLAMWAQSLIPATFMVYYLRPQPGTGAKILIGSVSCLCIGLLGDGKFRRRVFDPFNPGAAITSLILLSAVYQYQKHHEQFQLLWNHFIRFGLVETPKDQGLEQEQDLNVDWHRPTRLEVRAAEQATPEAADRRDRYASWPTHIHYQPLRGDDIRVLRLLPSPAEDNGEIHCQLEHMSLAEPSDPYVALSYCWGTNSQERWIIVDGQHARITVNLEHALRQLRSFGHELLWIDALCIDQTSLEERNAQILRMSAIYKKANEVAVWLGPPNESSDKVMMLIQMLASSPLPRSALGLMSQMKNGPNLDDLNAFMSRPFWQRVWVVQEVAAAAYVSVVCGSATVPWDHLKILVDDLVHDKVIAESEAESDRHLKEEIDLIKNLSDIRADRAAGRPLGLLEALARTRASMSTRAHDKVFGLLGITFDHEHFAAVPDYRSRETELCKALTISFITSTRSLDIIFARPLGPPSDSALPSWCPDYLQFAADPNMVAYLAGNNTKYRVGLECKRWNTTGTSRAILNDTFQIHDDVLDIFGYRVGVIDATGPLVGDDRHQFTRARRAHSILARRSSENLPQGFSTYNAMCRMLLIYDRKYSKLTHAPILLGMLYNAAYQLYSWCSTGEVNTVTAWLETNSDFVIHGRKLRERAWLSWKRIAGNYVGGLIIPKAKTMTILDYSHITKSVAAIVREGLRLMTTKEGSVGWAHPEAMLGDEIFLFAGCSLPVILRPKKFDGVKTRYQVVGHAYLDGVMNNEVWSTIERSQLTEVGIW